ncbi:MAG: alpha-glucan family phosphorylase [Pseudomonadota bacterium]
MTTLVAYISAEFGLTTRLPTYSGGLGILAGDHAKAAADLGLPLVGVSLWYHQGYGLQRIDEQGEQHLDFPRTRPEDVVESTGVELDLQLEGQTVHVRVWRYDVIGRGGQIVPIYFLDTMDDRNEPEWQDVSRMLYGGDTMNRLRQEAILGIGGYAAIRALYPEAELRAHLNEGHTAFFATELLRASGGDVAATRARCHFTTHTPVPAGHDVFDREDVERVLGDHIDAETIALGGPERLSMSVLALALSDTCNGVSELNAKVASEMFPGRQIDGLTNGVHFDTWVHPEMGAVFDAHVGGWRDDPFALEGVRDLEDAGFDADFDAARRVAKSELCEFVNASTGLGFDPEILTIGFARRAAPYKRAMLIFHDIERLLSISDGRLQLVFAGKAHPNDVRGRQLVARLVRTARSLRGRLRVAFLQNYSMWHGRMLTSGVDIWLNNPTRPMEACGTSGMKASLNGAPNFSVLDGWWAEACQHGDNGWALVEAHDDEDDVRDAESLYRVLENEILPTYYDTPDRFRAIRKAAVATAPRFSARRMVLDYSGRYYGER